MKKTALMLSIIFLFSFLTGCVDSKTSKQISELEKHAFSYDFTPDLIEDIKNESALDKWASKAAKQIENDERSELEVRALLSNLERAEYQNEKIFEQAKKFFKVDSYKEMLSNGNVIEVLEQLDEAGYYNYSEYDYYNIFEDCISSADVISAAKKQLTECNTESGYYDDPSNQKEERAESDDGLLRTEWSWDYAGDFGFERKYVYNSVLGNLIRSEFKGIYYKDKTISGGEELAAAIKSADKVYMEEKTEKMIIYSEYSGITANFVKFDIEN